MSLLWILLIAIAAALAVTVIVDVVRRHHSGWATAGWIVLVVILPVVGSLIYWIARKPTAHEVDESYLIQEDARRSAQSKPFDPAGM